jgi:hypothetical protein
LLVDSGGGTSRNFKNQLNGNPATTGRIAALEYKAKCLLASCRKVPLLKTNEVYFVGFLSDSWSGLGSSWVKIERGLATFL